MNIDWFPTLLDLCGLDASGIDVDGASIVPLIRDGAAASPHDVLHFDFERQWAVRRGDWKLICNAIDVLPNDRNKTLEGLYLTNLKIDRTESENLIDRYPEKAQELLALARSCRHLVCVCDDLWRDGQDYDPWTEEYRRQLAGICRKLAAEFDAVAEVICGLPQFYKHGKDVI